MDLEDIRNRFTYHTPKEGQAEIYEEIRKGAMGLVLYVNTKCPDSREKSLAVTKIEEAVFWANAAIARYGLSDTK